MAPSQPPVRCSIGVASLVVLCGTSCVATARLHGALQGLCLASYTSVMSHAGTGKTLVARALAASASRAGRPVAFFMRKGADILSKWVGEAERQLRALFAEAQRCQPSIIFFDEIDGLAPVIGALCAALCHVS